MMRVDYSGRRYGRLLVRSMVYEAGNCIWATPAQQAQNTRANVANWVSVRAMRKRRAEGVTYTQLVREFGMSYNNVRLICRGETWKEGGDAQ